MANTCFLSVVVTYCEGIVSHDCQVIGFAELIWIASELKLCYVVVQLGHDLLKTAID